MVATRVHLVSWSSFPKLPYLYKSGIFQSLEDDCAFCCKIGLEIHEARPARRLSRIRNPSQDVSDAVSSMVW